MRASRKFEVFAIPCDSGVGIPIATAVADDVGVGIDVVVSVWRADVGPFGIIEGDLLGVGDIAFEKFPAGVEIVVCVGRGGRGVRSGDGWAEEQGGQGSKEEEKFLRHSNI